MRIQLLHDFAGRLTLERRISPGEYEVTDPRLFGAGDYLVEHGFAVVVGAPEPEEKDEPIELKGRTVETVKPKASPKPKTAKK